jgi:FtsZ-binding cell division protein ZapB
MTNISQNWKPHWLEKLFRIAIPAALIYGGIKLFNGFAPTIITFFDNVWKIILLGVPLAFLVMWVISNPTLIWMGYKTICRKIASFIVKIDPLAIMDRYLEILKEKKGNLDRTKVKLQGKAEELRRLTAKMVDEASGHAKKGAAAVKLGDQKQASFHGQMAAGAKQSIELYRPIQDRLDRNIKFLSELSENWGYSIQELAGTIERKKTEYKTLRDMARALGQAEEFARGDSEAAQLYYESVRVLEENVTQKIAYIQDFEDRSKTAMKSISLDKQVQMDEGIDIIEQFMQDPNLFLPKTFDLEPADYQVVGSQVNNEYSKLLKN